MLRNVSFVRQPVEMCPIGPGLLDGEEVVEGFLVMPVDSRVYLKRGNLLL